MKHLLLTTIAAVVLVGCGESQQSSTTPEANPAEPVAEVPAQPSSPPPEAKPVKPVAEAATPEPPKAKAPNISIHEAVMRGNIEAVKQHIAAGTDVNVKDDAYGGLTPLQMAAGEGQKEIAELLIAKGADVNAKYDRGWTPLLWAAREGHKEIAELLIAKGADVNAKVEGGVFSGRTPLDLAWLTRQTKTADFLRKHGGKTGEELKAKAK